VTEEEVIFLTEREAAEYMGVSLHTLRALETEGTLIPFRTLDGHCGYSSRALNESGARHFHRLFRGNSAFRPGMLAQSGGYSQVPGTLSAPPSTRLNAY
jgi:hypothetical protein